MVSTKMIVSIGVVAILAVAGLTATFFFTDEEDGYLLTDDLYVFAKPNTTIKIYSPQGSGGYTGDGWVTGLPSGMTSTGTSSNGTLIHINVATNVPLWQEYVVQTHRIIGGIEYTRTIHILTNNVNGSGSDAGYSMVGTPGDLAVINVGQYVDKQSAFEDWEEYIGSDVRSTVQGLSHTYNSGNRTMHISGTPTTSGLYWLDVNLINGENGEEMGFGMYVFVKNPSYSHTITYNGNGATSGSVANTVVTDTNGGNSNVTLVNNGFYKAGYTFGGWSVGGVTYQPGTAIAVGGNASVTAYAVWIENTVSGTANNLAGLSGHSYTNQISAVASNNASFTFAVKSCSAGTASVNSAGLVTFNAPSVSATTNCNVVITVTAHYPDGQTKAADVAFTVSVDPVLVFTNSVTNGTLSIKGA